MSIIAVVPIAALGTFPNGTVWRKSLNGVATAEVVDDVTYASGRSLKTSVISDGLLESSYRAEVSSSGAGISPNGITNSIPPGAERWIGFACMYDPGASSLLGTEISFFQLMTQDVFYSPPNEQSWQPSLNISQKRGGVFVAQRYNKVLNEPDYRTSLSLPANWIGNITPGEWATFVVHVILGADETEPSLTEIWMNGTKVVENTLPNRYKQTNLSGTPVGQYLKFGNYSHSWRQNPPPPGQVSTMYHDVMCIGDETSSYDEIMNYMRPAEPLPRKGLVFAM